MTDRQGWSSPAARTLLGLAVVPLFAFVLVWTWEMPQWLRGFVLLGFVLPVVIGDILLDARAQRQFDEMEIAARSFAARWSPVAVMALVVCASVFDPFRSWLNAIYPLLPRHRHAEGPEQMFVIGVLTAMIVRGAGAALLRAAWMHARR